MPIKLYLQTPASSQMWLDLLAPGWRVAGEGSYESQEGPAVVGVSEQRLKMPKGSLGGSRKKQIID